jgi:hypothetical protein
VHVAAQNITLRSAPNTTSVLNLMRQRQSGLTLSASHPLIEAAQTVDQMTRLARRTDNGRYQALGLMTAGLSLYNAYRDPNLLNVADPLQGKGGGWSITATLGTSTSTFESISRSSTPVSSAIEAGRNISLTATGTAAGTGDINLVGARVAASADLRLSAQNDITLAAAVGRDSESTRTRTSSGAVGVSWGPTGWSVLLQASRSRGFSNGWGMTYLNTELAAGGQLAMTSGRDTTLAGAKATGLSVLARVGTGAAGGGLSITSPLDESHYVAREQSYGLNVSVPISGAGSTLTLGPVGLGLSTSQLRLMAEYEGVRQQSAISAGTGGYDIAVNGHTHLKGGAVTTEGATSASSLSTRTLTFEDVLNRDVVEGRGWSVSFSVGDRRKDANGREIGALAGSSAGFARLDTGQSGHTQAGVAGRLVLTQPAQQAAAVAALRARERAPVSERLGQVQQQLNNLYMNEPPPCTGCMIQSDPVAPLVAAPDGAGKVTAAPAGQTAASGIKPPADELESSAAWNAWRAQVTALEAERTRLQQRIAAIDAKVYGEAAALAGRSPSQLHQPVLHTFDRTKATQELKDGVAVTAAFGKAAYKLVGDFAGEQLKAARLACLGEGSRCADFERWGENGLYRQALHMAVGAISGGGPGAGGALAGNLMSGGLSKALDALGVTDTTVRDALMLFAASAAGLAAGSTSGAAAAFNADSNNRQLHLHETRWMRQRAAALAAQMSAALGRTVAEGEAAIWLHIAAESIVDAQMQKSAEFARGSTISEEARLFDLAKAYINSEGRGLTFVDERGRVVPLFGTADRHNPLVYSELRNNREYRDHMWMVAGVNLRPDQPTPEEQAIYEQRRVEDLKETGKNLLLGGVLGLVSRGSIAAVNRYSRVRTSLAPAPSAVSAPGAPIVSLRVHAGVELHPNLDAPASGWGYVPKTLEGASTAAGQQAHVVAYHFETKLANEVAGMNHAVLKWGDVIGRHGNDVVSVNLRTGEVVLWDNKYRTGDISIGPSPTFESQRRREAAVAEARQLIRDSTRLDPNTKSQALQNVDLGNYTTRTVGSGGVRNSVQVRYCNGMPC